MAYPIITASQAGIPLDSNVYTGGGTDSTAAIQAVLDTAPNHGGLRLVLDGAALVTGLRLHSNTTITCPSSDCGLFLAAGANTSIISNANWDFQTIRDHDIRLEGGTYNHNCEEQEHHIPVPAGMEAYVRDTHRAFGEHRLVFAMEFYGVRRMDIRDVTIRNQRTFGLLAANWEHVVMENIRIDLPARMHAQNQDGLHFWGPGRFLTLRNIAGCSGDDFLALAPDEHDLTSSITDVLIDGVFLDDADQGIRLLSRGTGRLDRVIIRNVTGTYRSFGFYINPWFPGGQGNYGSIQFEAVDLRQSAPNYDYTTPFLFRVGGQVDNLVLRGITHLWPVDGRPLFEFGWPYHVEEEPESPPVMTAVLIDGLRILERGPAVDSIIRVRCPVRHMAVRNVELVNDGDAGGCLVSAEEGCAIGTLSLGGVDAPGLEALVRGGEGRIGRIVTMGEPRPVQP